MLFGMSGPARSCWSALIGNIAQGHLVHMLSNPSAFPSAEEMSTSLLLECIWFVEINDWPIAAACDSTSIDGIAASL
jgi:hypothetical protein